jgi:hypothetical protein
MSIYMDRNRVDAQTAHWRLLALCHCSGVWAEWNLLRSHLAWVTSKSTKLVLAQTLVKILRCVVLYQLIFKTSYFARHGNNPNRSLLLYPCLLLRRSSKFTVASKGQLPTNFLKFPVYRTNTRKKIECPSENKEATVYLKNINWYRRRPQRWEGPSHCNLFACLSSCRSLPLCLCLQDLIWPVSGHETTATSRKGWPKRHTVSNIQS